MLWTAPPPARECHGCGGCLRPHDSEEPTCKRSTIGLDFAKSVFQVPGIDAAGNVVRRQLKRRANPEPSTHWHLEHFPEKWMPVFRRKCDQVSTSRPLSDSTQSESGLADIKRCPHFGRYWGHRGHREFMSTRPRHPRCSQDFKHTIPRRSACGRRARRETGRPRGRPRAPAPPLGRSARGSGGS